MQHRDVLGLSPEGFHRIAYTEWGEASESSRTTICVHGLTRNRRDFDFLATYLSQRKFHVFCPDIVGRGDSDWLVNPSYYTYEQYLADMNNLIARTNKPEIDWIGTSMGGLIGMALAALPKSPIKRLVLNDVGPQIPTEAIARLASFAGKDPDFASFDEAKRYFQRIYNTFGPLSDEEWHHLTKYSIRQVTQNHFVAKIDHRVKIASAQNKLTLKSFLHPFKALEGFLFDVDLWDLWQKVQCPVLVIHGKLSDLLLPETITKMQDLHADTTVIEIDHTGHAPTLYSSEQHQLIHQWLVKK